MLDVVLTLVLAQAAPPRDGLIWMRSPHIESVPASIQDVLEQWTGVTLFALGPTADSEQYCALPYWPGPREWVPEYPMSRIPALDSEAHVPGLQDWFGEYPVTRRVHLNTLAAGEAIAALRRCWRGVGGGPCFRPHYALQIDSRDGRVNVLFSFECREARLNAGAVGGAFVIDQTAVPVFDRLLSARGVMVIPVHGVSGPCSQ